MNARRGCIWLSSSRIQWQDSTSLVLMDEPNWTIEKGCCNYQGIERMSRTRHDSNSKTVMILGSPSNKLAHSSQISNDFWTIVWLTGFCCDFMFHRNSLVVTRGSTILINWSHHFTYFGAVFISSSVKFFARRCVEHFHSIITDLIILSAREAFHYSGAFSFTMALSLFQVIGSVYIEHFHANDHASNDIVMFIRREWLWHNYESLFGGLIHRRGDSSHESGLLFIRGAEP
jgi:hypothetical protein